jgi:hypothetical protein
MLNDNDLVGIIYFDKFARIELSLTLVKDISTRNKIYESCIQIAKSEKSINIWNGNNYLRS